MGTKTRAETAYSRVYGTKVLVTGTTSPGYSLVDNFSSAFAYQNTRTGENLPKWRSIIKSGGNATTPMSGTRLRQLEATPFAAASEKLPVVGDPATYKEVYRGFTAATITFPGHIAGTSLTSADNQALSRAYAKLAAQQAQFQGIVFLGELNETIKMLRNPFKGVVDIVDGYLDGLSKHKNRTPKRGRRAKTAKQKINSLVDVAASSWLEVAFGIKPLISDVKDLTKAITTQLYGVKSATISGYGDSDAGRDGTLTESMGNYTKVVSNYRDRSVQSVRYKARIDATKSADYGSIEGVQSALGFNLESFVPSIYNLIPWSFLLDYVTNVGNIIEAGCSSQVGMKFVVRTQRLETVRVGNNVPSHTFPLGGRFQGSYSPGSFVLSRSSVTRSSSSKLGMPTLEFSLPGSDSKYLNILALLFAKERALLRP